MARAEGQNLTTSIVHDLGIAIVTGQYTDANPFPVEGDLCKQYSASRSVLREAVKMLTAKGLLTARPRQGTRVQPEENWNLLDPDVLRWMLERKFSLQLLIEFTEIRFAVEPAGAALAARSATAADRAAISRGIEQMLAAERGEADPLETDIDFHSAILRASGNPFYSQLRELIATALPLLYPPHQRQQRRAAGQRARPQARRRRDPRGRCRGSGTRDARDHPGSDGLLLAEREPRRPEKRSTRLAQARGVKRDVLFDKARDEEIAVIIAPRAAAG